MIRQRPVPLTIPLSALAAATLVAVVIALLSALLMDDAQAQVATTPVPAVAGGSPFLAMMQGLVGLVIVIGVIFGAGWAMKKIGPRTRANGAVQVVGGASVGPREKVVVVRFGGQTLLLGVAPGQVTLLHTAEAGEPIEEPTATTTPRFVDRLRTARSGA